MKVERLRGGPWGQNCYLVANDPDAILVDPGGSAPEILETLAARNLRLVAIVNTHGHFDHIGAVVELAEATGADFYISALELPIMKSSNMLRFIFKSKEKVVVPTRFIDIAGDGVVLEFAGLTIRCLSTPGHTPGGYCFLIGDELFSGDTVLSSMPGTAELPGGNAEDLRRSLLRLGELAPDTVLHPGHGRDTTLGAALAAIEALTVMSEATSND